MAAIRARVAAVVDVGLAPVAVTRLRVRFRPSGHGGAATHPQRQDVVRGPLKLLGRQRRAGRDQVRHQGLLTEREARCPICAGCGTKFTDERWKAIHRTEWGARRETHPHLCDHCKQRAIAADRQAEQPAPEHQEQDQDQDQDQAMPVQKAGGGTWLSGFRS
ncbi:hypothetical protein [Streptomyces coeruleorubidus]|uniref:hypothetical protein n=1 Tax=Streptomyces coeruleorubidus TaxID=116188 RepID=UPI0037901ADC